MSGIALLAGLAACGAPEQNAAQATSTITSQPTASAPLAPTSPAPTSAQAAPTGAPATSGGWPVYRSDQAGYSVAYPAGWATHEQTDGGAIVATFAPPDGGPGISVSMQIADTELAEPLGPPNSRRCKPVAVGGINGRRCADTIMLHVPAPPGGQGKSYIIASTGAGIDQALYQRFLDGFTLT